LLILAMGLVASAIIAGTAFAGSYQVSACADTTPLINNSWQPFNNDPAYLETTANCGSSDIAEGSPITSGLAVSDVLRLTTNVPAGATAGWQVAAPAGDVISGASVNRDLYRQAEGWLPQIVEADGSPLAGESCSNNGDCEISGEATHSGLGTTSLAIELVCDSAPVQLTVCANGSSQHFARAELNSATVTITDDQPPQITSTSGELFTGGPVRGTIAGTVDGADNSGVQSTRLYVDGALSAQQQLACDYTRSAPCPAGSSNQFSLSTTTLANGPHQIQAAVVDAAGNQTLGSPVQLTVENTVTAPTPTTTTPITPPPPGPPTNGKPVKASPGLRILSVMRTSRALHVRGSSARTLSGHIIIVVHYTLAGRSHSVQKTVRLAHGQWAAVIGLPGGARTNRVSVLYRGAAAWLAQTVTRTIHHERHSG
jgi:hypothetical protein